MLDGYVSFTINVMVDFPGIGSPTISRTLQSLGVLRKSCVTRIPLDSLLVSIP